jgi:23S rRNA pseudouridine955/2504/2580 synthase
MKDQHRTVAPEDKRSSRMVTVTGEEAGRRLDNFLMGQLRGVPRALIYRVIRSGEVRVNRGRARPDRRLETGDEVRIPPVRIAPGAQGAALQPDAAAWIEQRVLYEDPDLLVLDKPAGLAAHGGSGVSLGAIELLRAARPDARALGLVHRLDRDTSGCLLVAKRPSSLRRLQAQFREGSVEKSYLALLAGRLNGSERIVDAPLLTDERRGGERHVRVDAGGKASRTRFVVERRLAEVTLVRAMPMTGRTHQIRVHAASIGLPLVGDERYGAQTAALARRMGLHRLFLHAATLAFESPRDERVIRVESPLPDELAQALRVCAPRAG